MNDNILFPCIAAGAIVYLMIGFILSRRRRDKEMFVRSQYFVILILGVTVINAICERLFG